MMTLKKSYFFLAVLLLFTSCLQEKLIDIATGEPGPPVVYAFLTPGDSVHLLLFRSQPIGGTPYGFNDIAISDANVSLSDELGNTIDLVYSENAQTTPSGRRYSLYSASQADFPITAGGTYYLEITIPSAEKLEAVTTLPDTAVTFSEVQVVERVDEHSVVVSAKWPLGGKMIMLSYLAEFPSSAIQDQFIPSYFVVQAASNMQYEGEIFLPIGKQRILALATPNQDFIDFFQFYDLAYLSDGYLETGPQPFKVFRGILPETSNIQGGGKGFFGGYLLHKQTIEAP